MDKSSKYEIQDRLIESDSLPYNQELPSGIDISRLSNDEMLFIPAVQKMSSLAFFPIIQMIFHPLYLMINTVILGRMSNSSQLQASFGLGSLTVSIFLQAIALSFNISLDTLIPQTYGAQEFKLCGIYLNRQIFLTFLVQIPLSIPLFWIEDIYIVLGQDPAISHDAAVYVLCLIPGAFLYQIQMCYARFCTGQRKMLIPMSANVGATLLHLGLVGTLVRFMESPILAISISSSAQFASRLVITKVLIGTSKKFNHTQHNFWVKETFQNLKCQVILSLQSLSLGVWGWWAFDIFTLMASYMSAEAIAAQTVLRSVTLIFYMVPVGISASTTILVGNNIGALNVDRSKYYTKVCLVCAFFSAFLSVCVMVALQDVIIKLFSSNEQVNNLIKEVYLLVALFVFFDCLQGVGTGVIRALGQQGLASIITCCGYWILGIPLSLLAVFYLDWGMKGLWLGPLTAIIFNFTFYYVFIWKVDWKTVVEQAREWREKANCLLGQTVNVAQISLSVIH